MNCETVRELLPLHAGNDLLDADRVLVERHLPECASCSDELIEYRRLLAIAVDSGGFDLHLTPGVRHSIAASAADAIGRRGRWAGMLPGTVLRRGLLAAAASLILLTGLYLSFRNQPGESPAASHGGDWLQVGMDSGEVRLAWDNGSRESYRVFKSRDPRIFTEAEIFEARGTRWTDPDPGSSDIVFYRVE